MTNRKRLRSLTLEILGHLVLCGPTFMINALFVPYGQTLGRRLREAERFAARCPHNFSGYAQTTVSATLSRMKKRKLVAISGPKKKAIWRIAANGRRHFKKMKNVLELPLEDGKTRVVVFDIPEDRHGERNWLRSQLLACDFTPLQKSVFMGIRPLPERLLKEFKDRGLRAYIHIMGLENE